MKKTLYTIFCAAIALAAVSCHKTELEMTPGDEAVPVLEQRTITAVQDGFVKTTTSDDIHIKWEKGDAIKVFDNYQNAYKFVADDAGFMTTFTGEVPSDVTLKYAVYPYSEEEAGLSSGFYGKISEVQDGKFNNVILGGVMAADGRTMKFTAVTSVIKLNVPAEDNVKTITVYSQKVLAGYIKAEYSNGAWKATTGSTEKDRINLVTVNAPKGGKLSGDLYITVHTTDAAPDLLFTFYNPEKHGKKAKTLTNKLEQNRITDLGVSKIKYVRSNKAFTVSPDGRQVYFTVGNLQYQPSTKTWRIAAHGYDYVGGESGKDFGTVYENDIKCDNALMATPDYTGWMDLFAYGVTGYKDEASGVNLDPCNYQEYGEYPKKGYAQAALDENTDWGKFCTIQGTPEGQEHKMRVLTKEEWTYLAKREPLRFENKEPYYFTTKMGHAEIVQDDDYSKVITYGTILLPEVFVDPETCLINDGKFLSRAFGEGYDKNKYTMAGWQAMEAEGAVMLPGCGLRGGTSWKINSAEGNPSNFVGIYWTSSWESGNPWRINLSKSHFDGPYSNSVFPGYGVRLVWDVEQNQ